MGGQPFVNQVGWMNPITGDEGNLTIDKIQSPGFISGTQGWQIRKDGGAEFNDVTARGTLQSSNFVAGVSGWQINNSGTAEFNSLTARGSLDVRNGNSDILIKNDIFGGFPAIFPNPDTTLYTTGIIAANALSAIIASLQLTSPTSLTDPGQHTSDLFLRSGTTATPSVTSANTDVFQVFAGFGFQGAAVVSTVTTNQPVTPITPGNTATIASVSIGAKAGCTYRIDASWSALVIGTPVAFPGNRANITITRNGTQIASISIRGQNSTIGQDGGSLHVVDTPGNVTAVYNLVLSHDVASTAANYQVQASATAPITLTVDGYKANI